MQPKVKYSDKGLANFFSDGHIEINKKLKYNKPLRDYIMKHELGHKKEFDLLHEFKIDWEMMPSLFLFVFKNSETWRDFSPIQFRKKKIIYDLNLSLLYLLIIFLIVLLIKIF